MIVVKGELHLKPEQRDAALAAFGPAIAATRAEDGCHAYVYAVDLDNADLVHVFEQWESDDALDAHMAAPHVAELMTSVAGAVERVSITRHDVSDSRTLM